MIQINNKMLREMKQLYIEGYGTKKIAKKFNLAVTTTRDYLLKAGVKFRKASKDKVPISQHNKFINLYQEGNSIKQIAKICNISFRQVDAFQIPIKVTINIFLSDRERGLLRETKIKEFRVNFVDDAITKIRNYLLDRIQELNFITINYGYIGAFKAKGIRFNDTKCYMG